MFPLHNCFSALATVIGCSATKHFMQGFIIFLCKVLSYFIIFFVSQDALEGMQGGPSANFLIFFGNLVCEVFQWDVIILEL